MRPRYPNLVAKLRERKITHSNLARALGISRTKLFFKFWGALKWELSEVVYICRVLADSDVRRLFR